MTRFAVPRPCRAYLAALAVAAAALGASGCAVERSPLAPAPAAGPELLLVFGSNRPPTEPLGQDLYYAVLSSGEPARPVLNVNTLSVEGQPSLSADGRWLAYFTQRFFTGVPTTTAVFDFETGEIGLPAISRHFFNTFNPTISEGGHYLAFHYQQGGAFDQLLVVEDLFADTLLPVPRLNELGVTNFDPSISADGSLIAYASNGLASLGGFDIMLYSVPLDSILPLPGLNSDDNDLAPAISADGRYIAFQSGRPGGAGIIDVYLYDRQTSALVPMPGFSTGVSDIQPAISPDGRYVACSTEATGGDDIRLYDVLLQRVVPLDGVNDPLWSDMQPSLSYVPRKIAK